jgi:hypothetical protein
LDWPQEWLLDQWHWASDQFRSLTGTWMAAAAAYELMPLLPNKSR